MEAIAADKIGDIYDQLLSYDVIGIDEGQFVSKIQNIISKTILIFKIIQFSDIVDYAEILANKGKVVIIAALDGNFAREVYNFLKMKEINKIVINFSHLIVFQDYSHLLNMLVS